MSAMMAASLQQDREEDIQNPLTLDSSITNAQCPTANIVNSSEYARLAILASKSTDPSAAALQDRPTSTEPVSPAQYLPVSLAILLQFA